jgi:hypothetical protein
MFIFKEEIYIITSIQGEIMKFFMNLFCLLTVWTTCLCYNKWADYGREWQDYGRSWAGNAVEPSKPEKPKAIKKSSNKAKKQRSDDTDKDTHGAAWPGCGTSWVGFGSATPAKDADQQDIFMNGIMTLRDRSVRNVSVNGIANLHSVSLNNLDVNGPVTLTEVTIAGKAFINGPLEARASKFNTIDISTSEMNLDTCVVKSINVKLSDNKRKEQVVMLTNTTVEESIVFEQGNGKVIIKGTSVVKGKIVGGAQSNA